MNAKEGSSGGRSSILDGKKPRDSKLQDLQKENAALSKELSEIKALHNQLLHEAPKENTSMKRINLLKSQVFQLERQLLVLSEAVNGNARTSQECLVMCERMTEQLSSGSCSNEDLLRTVRDVQNRLTKSYKGSASDNALPVLFLDDFIKHSSDSFKDCSSMGKEMEQTTPTLLEICSGRMDRYNLKQVGKLESKLATLCSELTKLQSSLHWVQSSTPTLVRCMSGHSHDHVTSCCEMIEECCHDLLCLSLLSPAAPWGTSRKMATVPPELSPAGIMKKLSPIIRSKKEVREAVEGTCKYFVHVCETKTMKCAALEEELKFHKSVYQQQVNYMQSLFDATRDGYKKFENSVQEVLSKPLGEIVGCYEELSVTSSNEALKSFLKCVQTHVPQLRSSMDNFTATAAGSEALGSFERSFFKELSQLEKGHSITMQQLKEL